MKRKTKKWKKNYRFFAAFIIIVLVVVSILYILNRPFQQAIVTFPDGSKVLADLADTQKEREKGLANVGTLESDRGMLFLFKDPNLYGFWSKDMKVSIDIIWCDNNGKVIYIIEDLPPCKDDCTIFYPPSGAKFVVEVSSGFVSEHGIKVGDEITYQII